MGEEWNIICPLFISQAVHGIGFSLACDFLKEIGFLEYSKPDIHVKRFVAKKLLQIDLKLDKINDCLVFLELWRLSKKENVKPAILDKYIYLDGSGRFSPIRWKSSIIEIQPDSKPEYFKLSSKDALIPK